MRKLLRRTTWLSAALLALLWACPSIAYESYQDYALRLIRNLPDGAKFRPDLESYLNQLASTARKRRDRNPFEAHTLLQPAARAQAIEMLRGNFVGHESKSGYRFAARFEAFAGEGHGRHGENAARDRQSGPVEKAKARALFQQWLDSTGHRRNLLHRDYRYVSTGVVQKGHHLYAVQIFWEQ